MTNVSPVNFLDNPLAPDIFADGATGWFVHNGMVRITFESARANHAASPGPINRVVIARIVMPVAQVEEMAKGLLKTLEESRAKQPTQGMSTIQ